MNDASFRAYERQLRAEGREREAGAELLGVDPARFWLLTARHQDNDEPPHRCSDAVREALTDAQCASFVRVTGVAADGRWSALWALPVIAVEDFASFACSAFTLSLLWDRREKRLLGYSSRWTSVEEGWRTPRNGPDPWPGRIETLRNDYGFYLRTRGGPMTTPLPSTWVSSDPLGTLEVSVGGSRSIDMLGAVVEGFTAAVDRHAPLLVYLDTRDRLTVFQRSNFILVGTGTNWRPDPAWEIPAPPGGGEWAFPVVHGDVHVAELPPGVDVRVNADGSSSLTRIYSGPVDAGGLPLTVTLVDAATGTFNVSQQPSDDRSPARTTPPPAD